MRKPRNSNVPDSSLLVPLDVTKFGSEDDPCFGKEYDLTTEECQSCGDHELCAISFIRTLKERRKEYEQENPTRDLELNSLESAKEVKEFVSSKLSRGFKEERVYKQAAKRYHFHISKIKEIVNG